MTALPDLIEVGEIKYENGDKYYGNLKNIVPHGKGIFTNANGDKFMGEYVEGILHNASCKYKTGNRYEGQL